MAEKSKTIEKPDVTTEKVATKTKEHRNFKQFLNEWKNSRPQEPPPPYTGAKDYIRYVIKRDRLGKPMKEIAFWIVASVTLYVAYKKFGFTIPGFTDKPKPPAESE